MFRKHQVLIFLVYVLWSGHPENTFAQNRHAFVLGAGYNAFVFPPGPLKFYNRQNRSGNLRIHAGIFRYLDSRNTFSFETHLGFAYSSWKMKRIRRHILYELSLSEQMLDLFALLSYRPFNRPPLYLMIGLSVSTSRWGHYRYRIYRNNLIIYDEKSILTHKHYIFTPAYIVAGISRRKNNWRIDLSAYMSYPASFLHMGIIYVIPFKSYKQTD